MNDRELLEFIAAQVGTLTEDMIEVKSRLTSVENKVTSVENKVTSIENKVTSAENRLTLVENKVTSVENRLTSVENRLTSVENVVTRIEHNHGQKLQALFDGYKQHTDQLERIEKEVSKHDEFILKKIK